MPCREVADGLAALGMYDRQLAVQQRDAASQQRRLKVQIQLYQSGLDTYQNVLTAQTALYNSQTALVTARRDQLIGGGGIVSSAGRGVGPEDWGEATGGGCGLEDEFGGEAALTGDPETPGRVRAGVGNPPPYPRATPPTLRFDERQPAASLCTWSPAEEAEVFVKLQS